MRIKQLDHYNIIANQGVIDRVINFYTQILGFEVGPRPDFDIAGAWLYREGNPLLHLAVVDRPDESTPGLYETITGSLHHIAFECQGLDEFKSVLEENGIDYYQTTVPGTTIEQLFLHDPAGLGVELSFKAG